MGKFPLGQSIQNTWVFKNHSLDENAVRCSNHTVYTTEYADTASTDIATPVCMTISLWSITVKDCGDELKIMWKLLSWIFPLKFSLWMENYNWIPMSPTTTVKWTCSHPHHYRHHKYTDKMSRTQIEMYWARRVIKCCVDSHSKWESTTLHFIFELARDLDLELGHGHLRLLLSGTAP